MTRGPDAQLDRTQVAERIGYKGPGSVDQMVQRSRARRAEGRTENLFPDPDGRIGRSPWWWASTIDRWMDKDRLHRGETPERRQERQARDQREQVAARRKEMVGTG